LKDRCFSIWKSLPSPVDSPFVILEHPSDLGIEARGRTPAEAFINAATGLMSVILDISSVEARESREIQVSASDREQLLVKWLSEVLFLYDGQGFVPKEFLFTQFNQESLMAQVRGEMFSPAKHRTRMDVKAVTYHQLSVRAGEAGTVVRVFLDI
jgi:SHS2 domain-containing protein